MKVPFISRHQRKAFDERCGDDECVALVERRMLAAKIGVSRRDRIGEGDKPASAQFSQYRFPFSVAESGLGQQFLFRGIGLY